MIRVEIGDKEYNLREAKTKEERSKGLSGIKELSKDEGMIFYFDEPQTVSFWMKDTLIPLDIIFINSDNEVISVHEGKPNDKTPITEKNVKYVIEVNANSEITEGDDLEFEDDSDKMLVLDQDGNVQMELEGGERIFSRISTKVMIRKAKKALSFKDDKEKYEKLCKSLGKYVFKELKAQDSRDPEYVKLNN